VFGAVELAPVVTPGPVLGCEVSLGGAAVGEVCAVVCDGCALFCVGAGEAAFWLVGGAGLTPVVTPGLVLGCEVSPGGEAAGEVCAVVCGGCVLLCAGEAEAAFWAVDAAGLAPVVTPGCGVTSRMPGGAAGGDVCAVVCGGCVLFCVGEEDAAFSAVGAVPA